MDLNQLTRRVMNPNEFQNAFVKFWIGIGAKIVQSKTIAELGRYHAQAVKAQMTFFKGVATPFETNMSSFTPAESEHFLISNIKVYQSVGATITDEVWDAGVSAEVLQNAQMTIVNNGVVVLQSQSMRAFNNDSVTTRDIANLDLKQPIAWNGQTPLVVTVTLPDGGAIEEGLNLRIELVGIGFIS